MRHLLPLAALLLAGGLATADDKKADTSTKVTGTLTVPKDHPSMDKLALEIRLYQYDPKIADKAADLVEKVEVKKFTHEKGKETVEKFEVGAKGAIKDGMAYYLTVYVLDGDTRVSRGELSHDAGLGKVLTGGHPREVKVTAKAIGKK